MTVRVVAALIPDPTVAGRFLVAQRLPDDTHDADRWEFPGGKVEPGEDDRGALQREIREELGVQVVTGRSFCQVRRLRSDGVTIDLHVYLCEVAGGEMSPIEVQAIRWVDLSRARALDMPLVDLPVLDRIEECGLS